MQTDNLSKIVNLRHELHMHPELSMEETVTAALIKDFIGTNTNLSIVDRGDQDRLQGGHGCSSDRRGRDAQLSL